LKYFRQDFERHIHQGHCPWKEKVLFPLSV
jgi:hypothetical protein